MKKLMLLGGGVVILVCAVTLGLQVNKALGGCPIGISNIQESWDAVNCELTISWDTDRSTSTNYVDWGDTCENLNNTANAGSGTHHSTTFNISGHTSASTLPYMITSSTGCGSQSSKCRLAAITGCVAQG